MKRPARRPGRSRAHAAPPTDRPAPDRPAVAFAPARRPFTPYARAGAAPFASGSSVFEELESRRLMTTVALDGGLLSVLGDDGRANDLSVQFDGADRSRLVADANGDRRVFDAADVVRIRIVGGDESDVIAVGDAVDVPADLDGKAGDDRLSGGAGADVLFGDSGSDTLVGNGGDDALDGGDEADQLYGGPGYDVAHSGYWRGGLDGNWGGVASLDDFPAPAASTAAAGSPGGGSGGGSGGTVAYSLNGGAAGVLLDGGVLRVVGAGDQPNDLRVRYNTRTGAYTGVVNSDAATFATGVRSAEVIGGDRADTIHVDDDVPIGVTINANGGNDSIYGGPGGDVIDAGAGDDTVAGNGGNDTLFGGPGNDRLDGGPGADRSDGGPGYDLGASTTFVGGIEKAYNGEGAPSAPAPSAPSAPVAPTPAAPSTPAASPEPSTPVPSDNSGQSPDARITSAYATTIHAGQATHFSALASTLNAGGPETARYEWDFGDPDGPYNQLVGFNAGHVYDRPGTYTVTLRVFNEGRKSDTATTTVTVRNAERRELYVSADGDDSNPGTWDRPFRTAAKVARVLDRGTSDVRVAFRRGDSFDVTEPIVVAGQNVEIGAYGSGAKPVLKWTGTRDQNAILRGYTTTDGWSIRDLTLDSKWNSTDGDQRGMPVGVSPLGENITVRDTTFLNIGYGVNMNGKPRALLMLNNDAPLDTGIRGYFAWVSGSDIVMLGNRAVNSTREHTIRISQGERVLIHDNDITNQDRSRADRYDTAKGAITVQKGEYAWVSGNRIHGPLSIGPLGGEQGLAETGSRWRYAVVEGNTVSGAPVEINHGSDHTMIRNNLLNVDGDQAVEVDAYNGQFRRGVTDITIANNTAVNTNDKGRFVWFGGSPNGAKLVNNVYIADRLVVGAYGSAPVYVNADNLNGIDEVSHNVWPVPTILRYAQGGINYVGYNAGAAGFQTPAEWEALARVGNETFDNTATESTATPRPGEPAATAGVPVAGVFVDFDGNYRDPSRSWSAGAFQV